MCDIGGSGYSLLLDEWNDIFILNIEKVSLIYCSINCGNVASTYLDLMQIEKCDTESIVSALKAFLAHNKFDVENVDGMGNKNASVMAGMNKVKERYSFIFLNPDEMCSSPCH